MKRTVSVLICAVLAAGLLAGCKKEEAREVDGTEAAITVNGESIDMGTASFVLRAQQAETMTMMEMYGFASGGTSFWDQSTTDEDGFSTTYGKQMKDTVKDDLVGFMLLREHAPEYGVELPEEVKKAAEEAAHTVYENNTEMLAELGTAEDDVVEAMELYAYPEMMTELMTADVDLEVSDEEAQQSRVTYARINLKETDESGNTTDVSEETKEAYKASMEELLKQIGEAGDADETAIQEMADAIDEEHILVGSVSYGADDAFLPDEVLEAAASLQDGETSQEVIETSNGYLYLIHMNEVLDRDATDRKKASIASERQQAAYNDIIQGWKDASEISVSEAWDALTVEDKVIWKAVQAAAETDAEVQTVSETETETEAESTSETEADSETEE